MNRTKELIASHLQDADGRGIQPPQMLELIDGFGLQMARMTKRGTAFKSICPKGQHCAHHGDDPYFCCRCGSEFVPE